MDLYEKIRTLPTQPGVYLYKNAEGEVIYVGKAKNLRSRVRSYLLEASQANAKTGSLMREAVDLDYILVANEHEALALENNLIKQRKPRFNILLRDDKTYPYVKLTLADRFPKVFVTRRLRKDGAAYYGPYFPGNLAYRIVELIHRSFLIPSCKVDLSRYHPRACLQYYIHRCLGPCVEGLTTPEIYANAVRDAQLFLEGKHAELERALTARMMAAAEAEQFETAARLRDQLSTVHQLQEKQRIATVEQDDEADVFGYHYEDGSLAVNLFHVRAGKIVDRREFFWEDLPDLLEPIKEGQPDSSQKAGAPGPSPLGTGDTTNPNQPQVDQPFHTGAGAPGPSPLGTGDTTNSNQSQVDHPFHTGAGAPGPSPLGTGDPTNPNRPQTETQGAPGPSPLGTGDPTNPNRPQTETQGAPGPSPLGTGDPTNPNRPQTETQGAPGPSPLGTGDPTNPNRPQTETQGAPGPSPLGTGDPTNPNRPQTEQPFHAGPVFSALLKQLYIDQQYVPRTILIPVDFDDRETLAALLTERTGHRIELAVPQRGEKRSLVDLAGQNAKQSYTQRFRVLEPSRKAIQEALADTLMLPELPRRIECFDISHIQGAETVASMVVWEDGKMNKQLYRKFKVMTVLGVDDFASMREVVTRRYRRLLEEKQPGAPGPSPLGTGDPTAVSHETGDLKGHDRGTHPVGRSLGAPGPSHLGTGDPTAVSHETGVLKGHGFSRADNGTNNEMALAPEGNNSRKKEPTTLPSLILVDGGLGQLHAAAEALESLGLTSQPLASIAKREEVIYLYGNEDEPIVLDRRSPVLHLIQLIRDESHRFAIGYHRQRRAMRDRDSELLNIPGVGPQTRQRLLTHFGSLRDVQQATAESLAAVVSRKTAETIWRHFHETQNAI